MNGQRPNRIVILGAPGAGKGTVALGLADALGVPHLSTGDMLRAAIAEGSEVGQQAKGFMDVGQFVPDEVIIGVIRERVLADDCQSKAGDVRYLLDGFPRTLVQAEALTADPRLAPELVIHLRVDDEIIVQRLTGRRSCVGCGASFHVDFAPPATAGICDRCGGELVVRPDDREETIRKRLEVYENRTAPLLDYYARLVIGIDGSQDRDQVLAAVVVALNASKGSAPLGASL